MPLNNTFLRAACLISFAVFAGSACSDTPTPNPEDAGPDGSGGTGSGVSGEGGRSGTNGATGGAGGRSGSSGGGTGGTSGGGTGGTSGSDPGDGGSGTGGDGGMGTRCGDVTCDPLATCDESGAEPVCECPFGYDDVSGFGTRCDKHDPPLCMDDGDCDGDDTCVDGVCCTSACDSPPDDCHTADGATCEDGENCVYPAVDDDTACDDGNICTDDDVCTAGVCDGTMDDCDDGMICTADSCDVNAIDVNDRCINDGTGITTTNCAADTLCESGFACQGNERGDCDPATVTDCTGMDDQCNVGQCDLTDGSCVAIAINEGNGCDDGTECNDGETCQSGVCTGGSARVCNSNNTCVTGTCDPSLGCQYTNNTNACPGGDADPCTVNERCSGGSCSNTDPMDCSGEDDQCNVGVCNGGSCDQVPVAGTPTCNDLNPCTNGERCGGGTCSDSNPDSACGVGSISCSGNPRVCVCDTAGGYVFDAGTRTCVPNTNECAGGCGTAACPANSTCSDPSSTCGNRVCTCNAGYMDTDPGAGVTCTDINECTGNPCDQNMDLGTCTQNAPGQGYVCSCDPGFISVDATDDGVSNPACVCNIGGTYALRIRQDLAWTNLDNIEDGSETIYSWAIRTHTYGGDGQLRVQTQACGGTSPDLCGLAVPGFLAAQAYTQYLTNDVWTRPGMPIDDYTITMASPLTGAAFDLTPRAVLLGISLTNSLGTWPASRCAVSGTPAGECGGTVTPTNGAAWTNPDGDTPLGITTYAVPPGGIGIDGVEPDPPCPDIGGTDPTCPNYELTGGADAAYGASSTVCPRGAGSDLPYGYFPGLVGFTIYEVKRFAVASRVISGFDGTFASCDRMTGDVTGPDTDGPDADTNGEMHLDARVNDCVRVCSSGAGCVNNEISCSAALTEFYDDTTGACTTAAQCGAGYRCNMGRCEAQRTTDASFVIKRVDQSLLNGGLTCAEVRAMDFN